MHSSVGRYVMFDIFWIVIVLSQNDASDNNCDVKNHN